MQMIFRSCCRILEEKFNYPHNYTRRDYFQKVFLHNFIFPCLQFFNIPINTKSVAMSAWHTSPTC